MDYHDSLLQSIAHRYATTHQDAGVRDRSRRNLTHWRLWHSLKLRSRPLRLPWFFRLRNERVNRCQDTLRDLGFPPPYWR